MENISSKQIVSSLTVVGAVTFLYSVYNHYRRINKRMLSKYSSKSLESSLKNSELSKINLNKENEGFSNTNKLISEELLEKLVEKIKNSIIQVICRLIENYNIDKNLNNNLNDAKHKDKNEKVEEINNIDKDNNIIIEDENIKDTNTEVKKTQKSILIYKENLTEDEKNKYIESLAMMETRETFMPNFQKDLFKFHNPKETNSISTYKIIDNFIYSEKEIISSFKCDVNQYKTQLKEAIKTNNLDNFELFNIEFDPVLTNNYIKIISNIYKINTTRTVEIFKKTPNIESLINDAKNGDKHKLYEVKKKFNTIYGDILNDTRQQVTNFFKVTHHPIFELPIKILLRIYPNYLDNTNPTKIKYLKLTNCVTVIINKLEMNENVPEICDPSNPEYCLLPKDVEYDFEKYINEKNVVNKNTIMNNSNNNEMSKDKKIILDKLEKKFNNDSNENDEE